tara:strand:- start:59 stop:391 length:333 start_codon:yes stop_codon:yes gene_type:complete
MTDKTLNVGDIAYGIWGYSMTIPVFAIVTRRTAKTVWFREIKKNRAFDMGEETPMFPVEFERVTSSPDSAEKPECRARIKTSEATGDCFKSGHAFMSKWDGTPVYANYMD